MKNLLIILEWFYFPTELAYEEQSRIFCLVDPPVQNLAWLILLYKILPGHPLFSNLFRSKSPDANKTTNYQLTVIGQKRNGQLSLFQLRDRAALIKLNIAKQTSSMKIQYNVGFPIRDPSLQNLKGGYYLLGPGTSVAWNWDLQPSIDQIKLQWLMQPFLNVLVAKLFWSLH